jgi:glutathione synthase/RimK-type ligase-like ATP-grasp enzyme
VSQPRIAIATCAGYDDLKVDDELLAEALGKRDCEAVSAVWNDPEADWGSFDMCVVKSTWDYHEKHGEFLGWARRIEAVSRLLNPAETIAWNSEKSYLRELGERGVRTVPTLWLRRGSKADLDEVLTDQGWERAVVKPVVDLGARNLHRVRVGDEGGDAALESVLRRHDAMVQPFLSSLEEQGETSLIYIDGELTHAVRKRPASGDFRVQSTWGGTSERTEPDADQVELAERAIAQLEETPLYARVDLVTDLSGEPCLIELELIEPNLYLDSNPPASVRLAEALLARSR